MQLQQTIEEVIPYSNNQYMMAFIYFVGLIIIFKIIQLVLISRLERLTKNTDIDFDDLLIKLIRSIKPRIYIFISLFISVSVLELSELLGEVVQAGLLILVIYQALVTIGIVVNYAGNKLKERATNSSEKSAIELLSRITKGVLWFLGLLLFLQNQGVNVTSLVAGLGIGGIAIGFALQNILGDLFSSFAIIFDKPFEPGDFIIVGEDMGVVEKVGIKTTRIRALQGEELVISNQELTSSRIQNYKKMEKRRVVLNIGLAYETSNEDIKKVFDKTEDIIKEIKNVEFERVFLKEFGDSALVVEISFYILSGDYDDYADINQKIMLDLKKFLEENNIEIPFPTRTVLLQK